MVHVLKSYPFNFQAVVDRTMSFQLRKLDRDYRIGDLIFLKECTEEGTYTGRTQTAAINNIVLGCGIEEGYGILNLELKSLAIIEGVRYESNA